MICNNNYLADILRVCEIKGLIWVMRFQSPLVYKKYWLPVFNVEVLINFRYSNSHKAFGYPGGYPQNNRDIIFKRISQ